MAVKKSSSCCDAEGDAPRKNASQRVFDAACELFYRRGIRAVGVDEIVCQAGVTKPSLYRAFASKDDLVAACLQKSADEVQLSLDGLMASLPDDPLLRLRAIVSHIARQVAHPDFRGCPLSNTAVEFPEPGHPGRVVLEACKGTMHGRIVALARRLPIADPDNLAAGLTLIIEGAMGSHHIYGSQGPSSAMVAAADALIEGFMHGARRVN